MSNEGSNTVLDGALLLRADLDDLAENVAEHCSQAFACRLCHRPAQIECIQDLSALVCDTPSSSDMHTSGSEADRLCQLASIVGSACTAEKWPAQMVTWQSMEGERGRSPPD